MTFLLLFIFIAGYAAIAFEHPLKINFIWYLKKISRIALVGFFFVMCNFLATALTSTDRT